MNAVGRLGSYISRGVYTVSGPFHPFGGCVDIIVVEQQDGTFKSSSWYVRFGKFQGVLKAREKVVNICVNGSEAGFHMYLDHKGEAFFLKDVDDDAVAEGKSVLNNSSSSSGDDETEGPARPASRDFGGAAGNGMVAARTNSRRAQILGLVFGRRSMKESEGGGESDMKRADSLERAEFAANLLEVKWSTNLDTTNKSMKDDASKLYDRGVLEGQGGRDTRIDGPINREDSSEESCVEETVLEVSCTSALEKSDETSTVSEGVLASESGVASNVTKFADESIASVIEIEEKADGVLSASVDAGLQVSPESGLQFDEGEDEVTDTQGGGELSECSISHKGGTFIYCESSESSIVRKDASSEQTHETLFIASGGSGELRVRSEVLRARTEPLSEDTVVEHLLEDYELEAPPMEGRIDYSEQTDPICSGTGNHNVVFDEAVVELESRTRTNLSNPNLGSVDEVELQDICTVSSYNSLFQQSGEEKSMKAEDSASELQPSSVAVTDCVATEITNMASSVGLEEEQLLFGDIDEFKISKTQSMESNFPVKEGTDNHSEGTEELNGLIDKSDESRSPSEKFFNENQSPDFESLTGKFRVSSSPIAITRAHKVVDEEVGWLTGSLPNMRSQIVNIGAADINCLSHSLDSNSKPLNWTLQNKDNSSPPKLNEDEEHQLVVELPDMNNALVTAEAKDVPSAHAIGDPSNGSMYPSGNWRIWPFSFRRSRSRKAMQSALSEARSSDAENASEVKIGVVEDKKSKPEPKAAKKVVRVLSPTSDQLASLNLKEGRNTVTFTFLTPMLGKQQVDARIYLWKWDTRIVISDVDGTITRSDVLGQFMPLVGVDWSHLGVAHLFSAIKDNGYQMLFLSARAISQAYITRQFLFNLKQDGKALPDGPVVISPDGLFPSLYREVIRRAPHEFKISCLEEIRSLFPSDCNPFYAGFGNRDTDEISYLKVGIPKGKIFIINPKGEVAVNRRVDTKSYKSIHALVNGMFPPAASSEQEDFNSWNFWKLPPPIIDV